MPPLAYSQSRNQYAPVTEHAYYPLCHANGQGQVQRCNGLADGPMPDARWSNGVMESWNRGMMRDGAQSQLSNTLALDHASTLPQKKKKRGWRAQPRSIQFLQKTGGTPVF